MEPAIHDLVRALDTKAKDQLDEAELEIVDDQLLDPWFFKTEEEIAAIEDDPTARIIEIKIAPKKIDYGTGFDDKLLALL